jgi:hypothetical protein
LIFGQVCLVSGGSVPSLEFFGEILSSTTHPHTPKMLLHSFWLEDLFDCFLFIITRFPSTEVKQVRLDISASSRDLHQQTDDPACWLAEVTVEDSSQSRVQN